MKRFAIFLLVVPMLFSCGYKEQIENQQARIDSLEQASNQKEEVVNEFLEAFENIESNLQTIKDKEGIIRTNTGENLNQTAKDRINEDILDIYKLLVDNKDKLNKLNTKLQNSNFQNAKLKKTIERLMTQLEEKNAEIDELKGELGKLKFDIDELNKNIAKLHENMESLSDKSKNQEELIDAQTKALNTAYYVVGSRKELKDNDILADGLVKKLEKDLNKNYFTEIDIREQKHITIKSDKALILSSHPEGSYKLTVNGEETELEISDEKEFWSVTKYLVIQVK